MRIYVDSSALIKRAVREDESASLIKTLDQWESGHSLLYSSTLAWIEVTRTLRSRANQETAAEIVELIENAVAGIAECPITESVAEIARRIGPSTLRSLDAIHLATATLIGAEIVCAYDKRLLISAAELGFRTISPA
ncbi:MAG TPA: type II toxin-antitoxin system VapC family toxin [Homoserinimonas sp.]|nr:type II toxin-antitoxin system VapC family toxin [Homoserinimonas sp.]